MDSPRDNKGWADEERAVDFSTLTSAGLSTPPATAPSQPSSINVAWVTATSASPEAQEAVGSGAAEREAHR